MDLMREFPIINTDNFIERQIIHGKQTCIMPSAAELALFARLRRFCVRPNKWVALVTKGEHPMDELSCSIVFGANYLAFSQFGYIFYVLSMPIESTKELCAYGRFLNGKRSWCFWGVRNSLGGAKWQAIFLTWRSDSPPLFPKTLTLVFLKALMRTNEYAGRSSHKHR